MLCLHLRVGMCSITFMLKCVSSEYKHGELAKKPGGKTVLPSLRCEWESTFYFPCAIYDLTTFLIHHITGRYTTKEGNSALVRIPALCFFFFPHPKAPFSSRGFSIPVQSGFGGLQSSDIGCWEPGQCQPLRDQRAPETSHLSCPHRGLRSLWTFPTSRATWLEAALTEAHPPKVSVRTEARTKTSSCWVSVSLVEQTLWGKHTFLFMLGPLFSCRQWRCSLIWTEARAVLPRRPSHPAPAPCFVIHSGRPVCVNDAVCRNELGAIPSIERSGCADWASLESAMRSVPLSTRDGLWESCGRRLCTAPAAPLGSPACHPPCGRACSPLTCGRSP